jgi:hypothetical protein
MLQVTGLMGICTLSWAANMVLFALFILTRVGHYRTSYFPAIRYILHEVETGGPSDIKE